MCNKKGSKNKTSVLVTLHLPGVVHPVTGSIEIFLFVPTLSVRIEDESGVFLLS